MSFTFSLRNEIIRELGYNPETKVKNVIVGRAAALCLTFPVQFEDVYQWNGLSAILKEKEEEFALKQYKNYIEPCMLNMYIGKQIKTYGAFFYSDLNKSYQKISFLSPLGYFTTTLDGAAALKIPKNQIISFNGRITDISLSYFKNAPSLYSFELKHFEWKPIA